MVGHKRRHRRAIGTLKCCCQKILGRSRIEPQALETFDYDTLHRARNPLIFRGPLLLCPKGGYTLSAERGRYGAAVLSKDALYTQNLYGISFSGLNTEFAYVLCEILNSSLTAFQLAFGGSTWGLERPTVGPEDLLSLRVPALDDCDPESLSAVIEAERQAAEGTDDPNQLAALDEAVFDLYELEPDERVLARESVVRARNLIFESHSERVSLVKPPDAATFRAYAIQVVQSVDAYLRARNQRHLEATIYPGGFTKGDLASGVPGITAVRFVMTGGGPGKSVVVRDGDADELNPVAALLRGRLETGIPPYLNERRQLRLYGADDLFVLKPKESRYWTRTAGLNDADVILADHWLWGRDAAAS